MSYSEDKEILVIGHKNPDTDSICAAIAYAALKNQTGRAHYVPRRAGVMNGETSYVLEYFGVEAPELISDVGAQVRDITIRRTAGVRSGITLKKAWELMQTERVVTLPIVNEERKLVGLISNNDIAMSYMEVSNQESLSQARPRYRNIIETLNGTLLTGNEHGIFMHGKVEVAAGNKDRIDEYLDRDDLVILADREEMQRRALELDVSCMVICSGSQVSTEILEMAKRRDCVLISTPYDAYTTARLINQSMPIKSIMTKNGLVTFELDDYVDDIREVMSKERHRDFPVLDENGDYVGMISRRNLLNMQKKQVILVDHNEKSQAVDGISGAEILEIIDHHRLGSLETMSPVFFRNQPLGSTSSIIWKMYQEQGVAVDEKIAGLLCAAIISDTLMFRSPTCTAYDREAAEELAKIAGIEIETFASNMFRAGSNFRKKSIEEICNLDFKTFVSEKTNFGVSQISAMSALDLSEVRVRVQEYLETMLLERKLDMVFVMLTNIVMEQSEILCAGEGAQRLLNRAFRAADENAEEVLLRGVVSRKKQFIPALMRALQENEL
ncbi:MAG: putative manganese-dependent inorganic diphosphatase [Eubacterium sp.]|nr:putative manganese-dependent inorganic diphosphatase [Eubacterium sp.]